MQCKKILFSIILITISYLGCKRAINPVIITNGFVCLERYDNVEFYTIYSDLYKITPVDFMDKNVGKQERLDLINKQIKVSKLEFDKLKEMGNVFIVEKKQIPNIDTLLQKYIIKEDLLNFLAIPDEQKGFILKYLWSKGYCVIFKEYRGDYVIVSCAK